MGASEEKEKNKEGQFPADATLAACKILLQPADTGTHSLVGWTWKDWDHSPIHPFLSSIHYAWFCSILGGRVYDLSGCMLAITPAELFTLHQNNSKQTSFQWAGQTSRTVCVSFKILRPQACNYQGPKVSRAPLNLKYEVNIFALSLGIILKEEWKSYCLHRCRIVDDYVAELYLLCETQDWLPAKIMFLTSFVRKQNCICPSKHSRVLIAQCLLCGTHHFNSPESN